MALYRLPVECTPTVELRCSPLAARLRKLQQHPNSEILHNAQLRTVAISMNPLHYYYCHFLLALC